MPSFRRDLLTIDRDRVDLRAGLAGLGVLAVLGAVIALVGTVALAAVIGALVMLATDPPPAGRSSATALLPLLVGGTLVTFLAVRIGDRAVPAAVLMGLVGVAVTLHAGSSRKAGVRGLVTTLWVLVALTLAETDESPAAYALAFAVGATVGAGFTVVRARAGDPEGSGDDRVEPTVRDEAPGSLVAALQRPLGRFAILRGSGLAVAVLLGFTFFPDNPAWMAVTALIVMRPPMRQALVVGVQRSIGTGLGVVVAVAVAQAIGDNRPGLVLLLLLSAFLMMAVREVNYALFAMVVTTLVIYSQRILGADAAESGVDRLVETVLGVLIAFVVLGLAEALTRTRRLPA